MIQVGDIAPRIGPNGVLVPLSRVEIVNQWSMWWGVAMMVAGSLTSLLAKPELFTSAFKSIFGKRAAAGAAAQGPDLLAGIEVDRKILADIAVKDPAGFAAIAEQAKKALSAA